MIITDMIMSTDHTPDHSIKSATGMRTPTRDPKSYDNPRVTVSASNTLTRDDVIEHRYGALGHVYTTDHILYMILSG